MEPQDLKFLQDNIINFETVKLGFTKNIPHGVLKEYEVIYRKYLDPRFILTAWCGACVMEMLQRLSRHYDNL